MRNDSSSSCCCIQSRYKMWWNELVFLLCYFSLHTECSVFCLSLNCRYFSFLWQKWQLDDELWHFCITHSLIERVRFRVFCEEQFVVLVLFCFYWCGDCRRPSTQFVDLTLGVFGTIYVSMNFLLFHFVFATRFCKCACYSGNALTFHLWKFFNRIFALSVRENGNS